jgi:hypothetical protein
MSFATLQAYVRAFFPEIPAPHWIGMGILALALTVFLALRRKYPLYGAVALGFTVLLGLFLLDGLVLVRRGGSQPLAHPGIDLAAEYRRLVSGNEEILFLILFNIAVFVPFGFTLAEFLASAKRLTGWRCLKYTALTALGLSLCIECLQLLLRAGMFELTDLVLNTAGAALGAALPLACRALFRRSADR